MLAPQPVRQPGEKSLTQATLENVLAADSPTVAGLEVETYVSRLRRLAYPAGFPVFWLARRPELPGYTVVAPEAPAEEMGPDGFYYARLPCNTGPDAAALAGQGRRCTPPGQLRTNGYIEC